jgi:hypothetical protein
MRFFIMILLCAAFATNGGCGASKAIGAGDETTAEETPAYPAVAETEPSSSDPCDVYETRAAEVWNPRIRGNVDFSVKIYAGEITAADAEWLATQMDRFTLAWIRLGRASCEARFETDTLSQDDYAAWVICFDSALEHQRVVVSTLATSGRDAGNDMDDLFAKLAQCVPDEASPELEIRTNPFKR